MRPTTTVTAPLPFMERLSHPEGGFRPSERKVAELVLRDPTSAMSLGMTGLASSAGVSEPTVMRFCNALGFDGFQAFKFALAQALAIGIPVTHSAIQLADLGLILRTFEDTDVYAPTVSRLAGLVLIDVLVTAVAVRLGAGHLTRLGEMKESLSAFRGSAERGPAASRGERDAGGRP